MHISWYAHDWSIHESYGRLSCEISNAIERVSPYRVNRIGENSERREITPSFGGFLTAWPSHFDQFHGLSTVGTRIALTMFESTRIPGDWIKPLNEMDAVVVPSRWVSTVFKNCGVTVPIYVVPLGISDVFQYKRRRKRKLFRILATGDATGRKGLAEVLFAFMRAFTDRKDVELVVKQKSPGVHYQNENIEVYSGEYSEAQMCQLYQSSDLFVFPSKGEGFGLPPREAAATGALAITTHFSGTGDDISKWGIPLGYSMVSAWGGDQHQGLGEWAQPDVDQLSSLMAWARDLPIGVRNDMGRHYAENIRKLYSWDNCARQLVQIWDEVTEAKNGDRRSA